MNGNYEADNELREGILKLIKDHSKRTNKTLKSVRIELDRAHNILGYSCSYKLKIIKK